MFTDQRTHSECTSLLYLSTHRSLWESVSQFTNAISYVDIDDLHDDDGKKLTKLYNSCHCRNLLYLLVSICLVIGQFSRLYFTVWPAKFKSLFVVLLASFSRSVY